MQRSSSIVEIRSSGPGTRGPETSGASGLCWDGLIVLFMWNVLWNRGGLVRVVCWAGAGVLLSSWLVAGALAVSQAVAPGSALGGVWDWPFILSFGCRQLWPGC